MWRRQPSHSRIEGIAVATLLGFALAGCGHGASVDLRNGNSIDGTIVGSDKDHLYLERDSGRQVAIDRGDIDYIDYPGNVLQIAGGLTLLVGISTADSATYSSRSEAVWTTAALYLPGLAMLAWGTYLNLQARGTARNLTQEQERIERERPYLPAPGYRRPPTYAPAPIYAPAPTYGSPPAQLAPWLAPPEIPAGQNRPDAGVAPREGGAPVP
jgi:hypothetical protein